MIENAAFAAIEHFYRRIYWQSPIAVTEHTPNFTLSYSGITWMHSINQLWLRHPDILTTELLNHAAKFFKYYHAEYSIVFSDEIAASVADHLVETRFERVISPVYFLRGLPRLHKFNREIEVVRVCADRQKELLQVLYGAFFMGPEIGRCIVRPAHFDDPEIRHYLAYVDGDPAASVTILLKGTLAGVWNVGTLRPFRRQGIASALMMRALADAAADGYSDSVLIASAMGRPMYEQMGYQWIGNLYHCGPLE
jgi:GNAT superfamily N-acetyltransferase